LKEILSGTDISCLNPRPSEFTGCYKTETAEKIGGMNIRRFNAAHAPDVVADEKILCALVDIDL
jgi:hypothetical protein